MEEARPIQFGWASFAIKIDGGDKSLNKRQRTLVADTAFTGIFLGRGRFAQRLQVEEKILFFLFF